MLSRLPALPEAAAEPWSEIESSGLQPRMKRALQRGQQVIVLIPEIALTTQIVHRFASRFRDVAVIHSGLTGGQ